MVMVPSGSGFQAGHQINKGRRNNPNGRPTDKLRKEIHKLLDKHIPAEKREQLVADIAQETFEGEKASLAAKWQLMHFLYGPTLQTNLEADERLKNAQAEHQEQMNAAGFGAATADELQTRAERNRKETSMWERQFVTVEDEEAHIRGMIVALNKPLLMLTPEKYMELVDGKDPSEAVEALKGYLGRSQAEIYREAMSEHAEVIEEAEEDLLEGSEEE